MKNSATFEEQIEEIAEALLSDLIGKKSKIAFRSIQAQGPKVSYEGASETAPSFDPRAIANYLRNLGDKYNEDLEQPARNIIAETVNKKVEKFGETVESLSRSWHNQCGMQYEKAFLVVCVKLFVYLAQKAPNIAQSNLLTRAISGNPEVREYIENQGGLENLGNRRG
ncbi:bcl-2-like protein 15 [Tiliqua scincoides]|uniref:bcl-2-like protein 15 n=1 Tax=Tiliqua scincoides TaxID=71010 RepID=UPI0034632617